jgi:membrane protein DedA with SNARE-associated domain
MFIYLLLFAGAILVDMIPLLGPPAWTVMVFFQIHYQLNIWWVLVWGVLGSAIGRYFYSIYIQHFAAKFMKPQKNEELQFLGNKMGKEGWKFQLFIFFYTVMPISSTPLFTATGIAKISPLRVLPAFFLGKFISDTAMVLMGKYAVENTDDLLHDFLSWKSITGSITTLILLLLIFFVDWKTLLMRKKLKLNFRIWR